MMRSYSAICVIAAFLSLGASAADSSPVDRTRRSETTLNEIVAQLQEHGAITSKTNWDAVKTEYLPKVRECADDFALAALLDEMVQKCGHSHVHVLPPIGSHAKEALAAAQKRPDKSKKTGHSTQGSRLPGDVGLTLCLADEQVCVLKVQPEFPAATANILPGDVITSINGLRINGSEYSDLPWHMIANFMLHGRADTDVSIELRRNKQQFTHTLKRKANGAKWFNLGVMPSVAATQHAEILPGRIGYIYFSVSMPPQLIWFQQVMAQFHNKIDSLIIDLRGNPGGIMYLPQTVGGWIADKELPFGSMQTKDATLQIKSFPQEKPFLGPIAVLTDSATGSVAEILAAGLQDNKRATIVGEKTMGSCLPSRFIILSTGFRMQLVFGNCLRANGKPIEKVGVQPDVSIKITPADLQKQTDPVLQTAIRLLNTK